MSARCECCARRLVTLADEQQTLVGPNWASDLENYPIAVNPSFSIAILVPAIITVYVVMRIISAQVITLAETKTISDLNSAREIYRNKISQIHSITRLTALRRLICTAVFNRDHGFLSKDLENILRRENPDILTILDSRGNVIARGRNPDLHGDNILEDRFIEHVIKTRQPVSGTDILSRELLLKASPDLAAQASMEVIPTPKAKERKNHQETSGMVLTSAVPLFDDNDNFLGVLIGEILLNRSFEVVHKIKEIVHEGQIYEGKEIGTAAIFQGDLRISTNVRNEDGTRAIGTLVSEEVYDAVLKEGKRWVGEAFVVNATYITAYEPIKDPMNNIIGMLYVGVLKQPFDETATEAIKLGAYDFIPKPFTPNELAKVTVEALAAWGSAVNFPSRGSFCSLSSNQINRLDSVTQMRDRNAPSNNERHI